MDCDMLDPCSHLDSPADTVAQVCARKCHSSTMRGTGSRSQTLCYSDKAVPLEILLTTLQIGADWSTCHTHCITCTCDGSACMVHRGTGARTEQCCGKQVQHTRCALIR
jgi:hypothetical protein